MDYEQNLEPHPSDVHRFFPEWADRPQSSDRLLEADHNSYLAGGYSEEFGYCAGPGMTAVFQPLDGDPDRSCQWAFAIGCLHPGYPECPRPADRGVPRWEFDANRPDALQRPRGTADHPSWRVGVGGVLRVDRSGADRHVMFSLPVGALWARLRIRARALR